MHTILLQCKLLQYKRRAEYLPLMAAFFREFQLDETVATYYSINQKRRFYLRVGALDKASHPSRTPAEIWPAALAGKLSIPSFNHLIV